MYYDSQTHNDLMQIFGDQKWKASTNFGLPVTSTRFTQLTSKRQRDLPLKDKDSNILHMIET